MKFWMLIVQGSSGGCRVQHTNKDEAMREAERLLQQPQNEGKKVFLLEAVGFARIVPTPIEWVALLP